MKQGRAKGKTDEKRLLIPFPAPMDESKDNPTLDDILRAAMMVKPQPPRKKARIFREET